MGTVLKTILGIGQGQTTWVKRVFLAQDPRRRLQFAVLREALPQTRSGAVSAASSVWLATERAIGTGLGDVLRFQTSMKLRKGWERPFTAATLTDRNWPMARIMAPVIPKATLMDCGRPVIWDVRFH